ncbi:MAG: leucine--tRNA ligase [Methanomassiliicoccales archaeon]|nr:MAG: leucine--tRNA ligase [Methanomassiliicoccales archaeon]
MTEYDPRKAEEKWQRKWLEDKVFEVRADDSRPKYFANTPYPYVNGFLHLGQAVTNLHPEIMSRYKRMKGFNVLFPYAFHCTGMPIVAAARRIKEGEPRQIELMKSTGIPEEQIPLFADENYWVKYFPAEARKDITRFGLCTDWSRTFITTSANPHYDKFVRWQFTRLKELGYVRLGEHPVVWCPKDQTVVGDHDRISGEGETPSEFTLLKFELEGKYLLAATLRPETVYGQTNLWLDPEVEYVEADVDGETWIINEQCAEKLKEQKHEVNIIGKVKGREMIGKSVIAPAIHRPIPILPTRFIDQGKGTGIVTSVPSDAPDDWVALKVLQEDKEECKKYGLNVEELRAIEPIPIIITKGWGPLPAVEIVDKMGIKSLEEKEKLLKAKEDVYKAGFYDGIMRENCDEFSGMPVIRAKDVIKEKMIEEGEASTLYEPSGDVVCRCLTPSIVKIVSDQWFLAYGDDEWKSQVHECLDDMTLYPEISRKQFDYVIDWLTDWACTHHFGLGTRLPWDEKWVIESLSDSTIYMAYYTISHVLQQLDPEKITDEVFDFLFKNIGTSSEVAAKTGIPEDALVEMRREFEYWYPFDLRHSAKDLIQNHLTFALFSHVAIFDRKYWPRGYGINGYITVREEKMSKSLGNVRTLRDALNQLGADVTRITLAQGGEGLDDPSFDPGFALTIGRKLKQWYSFATEKHETREEWHPIDSWFRSVMNKSVKETEEAMEQMNHRTALKICYFDLQREWQWYLRRTSNTPNSKLLEDFVKTETKLLSPFVPHLCEEIWEALGKEGYISRASYPESKAEEIDRVAERSEEFLKSNLEDIREILKVTKIVPKKIVLYLSPDWKNKVYLWAIQLAKSQDLSMKTIMEKASADDELKEKTKVISQFAGKVVKDMQRMSSANLEKFGNLVDEKGYLSESVELLKTQFSCDVEICDAEDESRYDPKSKAKFAMPWRPAIFVE